MVHDNYLYHISGFRGNMVFSKFILILQLMSQIKHLLKEEKNL